MKTIIAQMDNIINHTFESANRVYDKKACSPTLNRSREVINPFKNKSPWGWHWEQQVYDRKGIARTVKAGEGSGNNPKVIKKYENSNSTEGQTIKSKENRIRQSNPKGL